MTEPRKPDLRDQTGRATITNLEERFAGDENRKIEPKSGEPLVTPDPGKVPTGQTTKM